MAKGKNTPSSPPAAHTNKDLHRQLLLVEAHSDAVAVDLWRFIALAKVLKPCDCTHDSEVPRCGHVERRIKVRARREHLLKADQIYLCFVCADELKADYTDLSNWTNGICDGCGHLQARECAIPVPED